MSISFQATSNLILVLLRLFKFLSKTTGLNDLTMITVAVKVNVSASCTSLVVGAKFAYGFLVSCELEISYHCYSSDYFYFRLLFTYSFSIKGIDDAGAQSLAKGLLHCTNLQELQ